MATSPLRALSFFAGKIKSRARETNSKSKKITDSEGGSTAASWLVIVSKSLPDSEVHRLLLAQKHKIKGCPHKIFLILQFSYFSPFLMRFCKNSMPNMASDVNGLTTTNSVQKVLPPTYKDSLVQPCTVNGVPPAPVHGLSSPAAVILLHTSCCSSVTAALVASRVMSTLFTVP